MFHITEALLLYKGINYIKSYFLTLIHIVRIIRNDVVFAILVGEFQNATQTIVIFKKFFDVINSFSLENLFVVGGEGDSHVVSP
jgi:hypothetical protein